RERRARRARLGRGRKRAAEGDVVRARPERLDREVQPVVAGGSEDLTYSQARPRRGERNVVAAEVNPVDPELDRQIQIVVNDERNALRTAEREEGCDLRAAQGGLRGLVPVLNDSRPAGERLAHLADERCAIGLVRRDRV